MDPRYLGWAGPVGVLLAGRYRLEDRIAGGAVGEVWRATDLVLARPVAVKLLRAEHAQHAETLTRFRAEARYAASLSHPGIVQVYDYLEADASHPPFLVIELVEGPSLAGLLVGGPLEPASAMDLVAQAAAGLDAAHQAGLVHRDIKPANLLIGPGGRVKITDFGIAHAAGSASFTCAGMLVGTAAYLAPERVVGDLAGPASDLYALGIVGYECLAGAPPFGGMPVEVALAHRDRPLPPLPVTVPADVAALVADLTAKDPAVRPAPASQVASRAGRLRDAMTAGRAIRLGSRPDQPRGALAAAQPRALTHLPPEAAMPGQRPASGQRQAPGRGKRSLRAVAPVLAAALAVGLLGILLAGVSGSVLLHQAARPLARASASSAAAAGKVKVDGGSLAGQPVSMVRQQLRQLGLVVRVLWRPSDQLPAGTVVSVDPAGWVPVGSAVIVTGALRYAGHRLYPDQVDRADRLVMQLSAG